MWEYLQNIKAILLNINEFDTVMIGEEKGIGAKDCPACRIVLSETSKGKRQGMDDSTINILIVVDVKNNIEDKYQEILTLENKVRSSLSKTLHFSNTIYDNDQIPNLKASRITFNAMNIPNEVESCR